MTLKIAMTGATGFVGGAVLDLALNGASHGALAAGCQVNALVRQPQFPREGVTWVPGSLGDPASLDALVRDADMVLHIAGVVNAPDRAGFEAGNATGTMRLIDAMRRSHVRRLVHVSSLAAREPALSHYGWSKELAERHVMASGLDWTIVRPPAIYGPGDKEMLDLFRMAARGVVMLPPGGRLSVIEVGDLARLLLALAGDRSESLAQVYEVDDGVHGGWSHAAWARAIGRAVGRNVRTLATPRWLLSLAARADRAVRGEKARLTQDRVRYFCHPDWLVHAGKIPSPGLWEPRVPTAEGLKATAAAYRMKGWI